MKNYAVLIKNLEGDEIELHADLSLNDAKKLASHRSADEKIQVFIVKFRIKDGQEMYYNRDGHNCVGKAW